MKIFLASAIAFCLPLCANLNETDITKYIKEEKNSIGFLISCYEMNGAKYDMNFDYHMGYLSGKYDAYNSILNHFEQDQASP